MRRAERIKRRNRRRRLLLSLITLIGLISLAMYFLLNSDTFKIQRIIVQGNNEIPKEDIIFESEVSKGENLFKMDRSHAEKNISLLPYVKSVKIRRKLPNTVMINIVEREEHLLIENIASYYVADEEGHILKQVDEIKKDLVLIKGTNIRNLSLGSNALEAIDKKELSEMIFLSKEIGIDKLIENINLEKLDNINIQLNNGIDVAFGQLSNVKYKLGMLSEILKDIENKGNKYKKIIMNKGSHPILVVDE